MPDYFTQFVVDMKLPLAHLDFWKQAKLDLSELEAPPENEAHRKAFERLYGAELLELIADNAYLGFEIHVNERAQQLELCDCGDHGNPHAAGLLLRRYLYRFGIAQPIAFTYAATCSSRESTGFGGGWVHVTRRKVTVHDAYAQMQAKIDLQTIANELT